MLVLSRKVGETIVINGQISIMVTAVQGGTVRIGIQAPREVPVHRGELLQGGAVPCRHRQPCAA